MFAVSSCLIQCVTALILRPIGLLVCCMWKAAVLTARGTSVIVKLVVLRLVTARSMLLIVTEFPYVMQCNILGGVLNY